MAASAPGVHSRRYDSQQTCPVARTLDLVGDRWTILILRDLAFGTRRFVDLEASLEGIAPNLLTGRLKALEAGGMVRKVAYSQRPPRSRYELTDRGRDFIPVLRALAEFGTRHLGRPEPAARGMVGGAAPLEQP